jgi:hypothetical protein
MSPAGRPVRWIGAPLVLVRHRILSPPIVAKNDDGATLRFDDPEYWRRRAEEARAHAARMGTKQRRGIMLRIAGDYDLLAAPTNERSKPKVANVELLIAVISWVTVFGLIAALIGEALR